MAHAYDYIENIACMET